MLNLIYCVCACRVYEKRIINFMFLSTRPETRTKDHSRNFGCRFYQSNWKQYISVQQNQNSILTKLYLFHYLSASPKCVCVCVCDTFISIVLAFPVAILFVVFFFFFYFVIDLLLHFSSLNDQLIFKVVCNCSVCFAVIARLQCILYM